MHLSSRQIANIKQIIQVNEHRSIVRIDVSEDRDSFPSESSSNIYCITLSNEIIWQVSECQAIRPFDDDMFIYVKVNDDGQIIAHRFSGFFYQINKETGEAVQLGFNK